MGPIYCLMKTGVMMTPGMCDAFYAAARECVLNGVDHVDLQNDMSEGRVTDTGRRGSLGGVSGAVFEGILEWEGGQVRATFIVRTRDLPSAEEVSWHTQGPNGDFVPLEHMMN